jgi:hypothetical protein
VVAGAAADVALQLVADGFLVRLVAVAVHDIDRRHDHAWGATAALQAKIAAEGGLHRVQLAAPMVLTLEPAAYPNSTVQELTALASTWTVRAPHCLVSQPI